MLKFSVQESSGTRVTRSMITRLPNAFQTGVRKGLIATGGDLYRDLRKDMLGKKTGRTYIRRTRSGSRRRHRASAPGETPANMTGNYRKNVGFQMHGTTRLEFGVRDVKYAEYLEDGTKRGGKVLMAPRPGVTNTIKANNRNTFTNIMKGINAAVGV